MKLTKEQVTEILMEQSKSIIEGDGFSGRVKSMIQEMVDNLRGEIIPPAPASENVKDLIASLPFGKVSGDHFVTEKGSIINLKNKMFPWTKLSNEMKDWAVDFAKYLKTGEITKLLSSTSDPDGGYLVPEDFRAIMLMYDVEPTLIWQRATVWPMGLPKLSLPKLIQNPDVEDADFDHFAGVTFDWIEEGSEKPETQPSFGFLELIVHEIAGYTEITNTLLDDSIINFVNFLTQLFRKAWYWVTDKAFIQGTGGKQPLGIYNDPGVLIVNRTTSSTVTIDDILRMDSRIPAVFDASAVWFYSKRVREKLRGQKTTGGELVLQENWNQLQDGYPSRLLGRPAILADGKIASLGNFGDVVLADWSYYYIGLRQDFTMDSSRHAGTVFRNNRTALRCSGRVDGANSYPQSCVILGEPS